MTSSSVAPAAPAAPNTQNIAVGLLVAEAMSKSNNASQKQLQSQKEIGEQFMEQNIATAIQQIMENAPDHTTALDDIKKFLNQMDANDQSWGSDIQNWIKGELRSANSYSTPQADLDTLNGDVQQLQKDQQSLQEEQNNLNACESTKDDLVAQLNNLNNELNQCPWYEKGVVALEIAGVAIAIGFVDIGIGICQAGVNQYNASVERDQQSITSDKQTIGKEQGLVNTLQMLSGGNTLMQSEASQSIADYKATENRMEAFDKAIDSIIEELTSTTGKN